MLPYLNIHLFKRKTKLKKKIRLSLLLHSLNHNPCNISFILLIYRQSLSLLNLKDRLFSNHSSFSLALSSAASSHLFIRGDLSFFQRPCYLFQCCNSQKSKKRYKSFFCRITGRVPRSILCDTSHSICSILRRNLKNKFAFSYMSRIYVGIIFPTFPPTA